jgi:hypothetical protein
MTKYKSVVAVEAFQLTYEMAMGNEAVPSWFAKACLSGDVQVFVTEKIRGSQYCHLNAKSPVNFIITTATDFIIKRKDGTLGSEPAHEFLSNFEVVEE